MPGIDVITSPMQKASLSLSSTDAGVISTASVSFATSNFVPAGGWVEVQFDPKFNLSLTSVSSSNGWVSDVLIFGSTARLMINSASGMQPSVVSFRLTGIRNPIYPGASPRENYLADFVVRTVGPDGIRIDESPVEAPVLLPAIISQPSVNPIISVTGGVVRTTVSFQTPVDISPMSRVILLQPKGFSVCRANGSTSLEALPISGFPQNCTISACPVGDANCTALACADVQRDVNRRNVDVSLQLSCRVPADTFLSLSLANIVTSNEYGRSRPHLLRILDAANCGEGDMFCAADAGIQPIILETNVLRGVSINMSSYDVGALNVQARFTLTVVNPVPAGGRVLVDFPQRFPFNHSIMTVVDPAGSVCACNSPTSAACCYGQSVWITLPNGLQAGSNTTFLVRGFTNRLTGGIVEFQIRTTTNDDDLIFIDRSLVDVRLAYGQMLLPSVMPIERVDLTVSQMDGSISESVVPETLMRSGAKTTLLFNFTTSADMPAVSRIRIIMPRNFNLDQSLITHVSGLSGSLTLSFDENARSGPTIMLTRVNGAMVPKNTEVTFRITRVVHSIWLDPPVGPSAPGRLSSRINGTMFTISVLSALGGVVEGVIDEAENVNAGMMWPGILQAARVEFASPPLFNSLVTINVSFTTSSWLYRNRASDGQRYGAYRLAFPLFSMWQAGFTVSNVWRVVVDPTTNRSVEGDVVNTLGLFDTTELLNGRILILLPRSADMDLPPGSRISFSISGLVTPKRGINSTTTQTIAEAIQQYTDNLGEFVIDTTACVQTQRISECVVDQATVAPTFQGAEVFNGEVRVRQIGTTNPTMRLNFTNLNRADTMLTDMRIIKIELESSEASCNGISLLTSGTLPRTTEFVDYALPAACPIGQPVTIVVTGGFPPFDVRENAEFQPTIARLNFLPLAAPGAPTNVAISTSRRNFMELNISWTPPANMGAGASVTSLMLVRYVVYWRVASGPSGIQNVTCCSGGYFQCCGLDRTFIRLPTLAAGSTLSVQLSLVNPMAESSLSTPASNTARLIGPPALVPVTISAMEVTGIRVTWTAPSDTGCGIGSGECAEPLGRLIDFELEYQAPSSSTWLRVAVRRPTDALTFNISTSVPGLAYRFRVRARNGVGYGAWSTHTFIGQGRPTTPSLYSVDVIADRTLRVGVLAPSDTGYGAMIYPNTSAILITANVLSSIKIEAYLEPAFQPCCAENPDVICNDTSMSAPGTLQRVMERTINIPSADARLVFVNVRANVTTSVNRSANLSDVVLVTTTMTLQLPIYYVNVTGLTAGTAYRFRAWAMNGAGTSLEPSNISRAVQAQGFPLPNPQFLPNPPLGPLTATLSWSGNDVVGLDHVYKVMRRWNSRYPFVGSVADVHPAATLPSTRSITSIPLNDVKAQHVRTYGPVHIDGIGFDGNTFLAVANTMPIPGKAYTTLGNKDMYVVGVNIYRLNATTGLFGGDCRWPEYVSATDGDINDNTPRCTAFHVEGTKGVMGPITPVHLSRTGAHQIIPSFAPTASTFVQVNRSLFLFVANSRPADGYKCTYPTTGECNTGFCHGQPYVDTTGNGVGGAAKMPPDRALSCSGRSASCPAGSGTVCRPVATGQPNNQGSNELVIYQFRNRSSLFLERQFFEIRNVTNIMSKTAQSCVPTASGSRICTTAEAGCTCTNRTYVVVSDAVGATLILAWNATQAQFNQVQAISVVGASGSTLFTSQDTREVFLVISRGMNDTASRNPSSSSLMYRLENGLFVERLQFPTYAARNVEHLTRNGTDYIIVTNGGNSPRSAPTCTGVKCTGPTCTCISQNCNPAGCPIMYSWNNRTRLVAVQRFAVEIATSVKVFSRFNRVLNLNEDYLIFANGHLSVQPPEFTQDAWSQLYKWETIISSIGETYFNGFALARRVFTRSASSVSVFTSHTGATMASFVSDQISTSLSIDQCQDDVCQAASTDADVENCNYRVRRSCCEKAGDACHVLLVNSRYVFNPVADISGAKTYADVFALDAWPVYDEQIVYNCTRNTYVAQGFNLSVPGDADYEFFGQPNIFTVYTENRLGTSAFSPALAVRGINTPSQVVISEVRYLPNIRFQILWSAPPDGDVRPAESSSIVTGYRVFIYRNCSLSDFNLLNPVLPVCNRATGSLLPGRPCCALYQQNEGTATTFSPNITVNQGERFELRIMAANRAGFGPPSEPEIITGLSAPSPVRDLDVRPTLGPLQLNLSWFRPDDVGLGWGVPPPSGLFFYYRVEMTSNDTRVTNAAARNLTMCFAQDGTFCACGTCRVKRSVTGAVQVLLPDTSYGVTANTLVKGARYNFTVYVINSAEESRPVSRVTCSVTAAGRPTNIAAEVGGNLSVRVSWTKPVDQGAGLDNTQCPQGDIYAYIIEVSTNPQFIPLTVINGSKLSVRSKDATSFLVTGLTKGRTYYFAVLAENLAGTSYRSAWVQLKAATLTSPPTDIRTRVMGNRSVQVTWEPPLDSGLGVGDTSGVQSYRVQVSTSQLFTTIAEEVELPSSASRNYTFSGLAKDLMHYFRVSARNSVGLLGEYTVPAFERSVTFPSQPIAARAVSSGDLEITVTWQQPSDAGIGLGLEYPLISYTFQYTTVVSNNVLSGLTTVTIPADAVVPGSSLAEPLSVHYTTQGQLFQASGLRPDGHVVSTTVALNASDPCSCISLCAPLSGFGKQCIVADSSECALISPPTNPVYSTVLAEAACASLSFDGICLQTVSVAGTLNYVRECIPAASVKNQEILSYTIRNLDQGKIYYFRILANNFLGEGASVGDSAEIFATAVRLPSPPTNVRVVPLGSGLLVTWEPPTDTGMGAGANYPLIGYLIQADTQAFQRQVSESQPCPYKVCRHVDSSTRFFLLENLSAEDGVYSVRIYAISAVGSSPSSAVVQGMAAASSLSPANLRLVCSPSDSTATLTWSGVTDIKRYEVQVSMDASFAERRVFIVSDVTLLIHNLPVGFFHYARARGWNDAGTPGPFSSPVNCSQNVRPEVVLVENLGQRGKILVFALIHVTLLSF